MAKYDAIGVSKWQAMQKSAQFVSLGLAYLVQSVAWLNAQARAPWQTQGRDL